MPLQPRAAAPRSHLAGRAGRVPVRAVCGPPAAPPGVPSLGDGPRMCTASASPRPRSRLLLATILPRLQLSRVGHDPVRPEGDATLRPKGGLRLRGSWRRRVDRSLRPGGRSGASWPLRSNFSPIKTLGQNFVGTIRTRYGVSRARRRWHRLTSRLEVEPGLGSLTLARWCRRSSDGHAVEIDAAARRPPARDGARYRGRCANRFAVHDLDALTGRRAGCSTPPRPRSWRISLQRRRSGCAAPSRPSCRACATVPRRCKRRWRTGWTALRADGHTGRPA